MTIEEKIKQKIIEQYKSIRAFSIATNIPYSTIDTMLKKGIAGTGVVTLQRICAALGILMDGLEYNEITERPDSYYEGGVFFFGKFAELISFFEKLDEDDQNQVTNFTRFLSASSKYEDKNQLSIDDLREDGQGDPK